MSDKEKELAARIAAMPSELQDKFLDQAKGATMALDILEDREKKSPGEDQRKEG